MKIRAFFINQHGFSLIEMMMVIAIVTILSAIAIPIFGGFLANRDLKSAARDIAGDIYEYRQRAIAENRVYQITFNVNGNYVIRQCNDTSSPCSGTDIATKSPSAFRNGISISGVTIGGPLQIQPRGTVSPAGGSVTLQNSRLSTATVTINLTGRTYVDWTDLR